MPTVESGPALSAVDVPGSNRIAATRKPSYRTRCVLRCVFVLALAGPHQFVLPEFSLLAAEFDCDFPTPTARCSGGTRDALV